MNYPNQYVFQFHKGTIKTIGTQDNKSMNSVSIP